MKVFRNVEMITRRFLAYLFPLRGIARKKTALWPYMPIKELLKLGTDDSIKTVHRPSAKKIGSSLSNPLSMGTLSLASALQLHGR